MDSKKQNIYKRIESGLRFKQVRVALGKTQEEFAEILGLSVNSIKKIEKGENNVSVSNLRKLRKSCNVSADYILYGESKSLDDIWFLLQNADDKDKLKALLRLVKYFANKDRNFYVDESENEYIFSKINEILEDKQ